MTTFIQNNGRITTAATQFPERDRHMEVTKEMTNGSIEPAHYGPIGDAARNVASYCDGPARVHVYTAAFNALTTAQSEAAELRGELERLRRANHEAILLIDEINKRKSSRDFNGICQALHSKLSTIRITLAHALSETPHER